MKREQHLKEKKQSSIENKKYLKKHCTSQTNQNRKEANKQSLLAITKHFTRDRDEPLLRGEIPKQLSEENHSEKQNEHLVTLCFNNAKSNESLR